MKAATTLTKSVRGGAFSLLEAAAVRRRSAARQQPGDTPGRAVFVDWAKRCIRDARLYREAATPLPREVS